jgi:hypothetical protein
MPATARAKELPSENLSLSNNKFNAERTNSMYSAVTNQAPNSTTGSRPKSRFSKLKQRPSLIRTLRDQIGPKGEVIVSALSPGTTAAPWSQNAEIHSAYAAAGAAHFPCFFGGGGLRGLVFGIVSANRRTGFHGRMTCG